MKLLTFAEMFSGIGGFRLGLESSGWRCVWANDNNKYANKIYKKKWGDTELVEGDIGEVDAKTIPDHTLLTAGFPCQAFSIAGKRQALKENRGTLFTHIIRVASCKKPKLLLLENVKGLLSSDAGRTFAVILRALAKLGYLLEWQVLNSKHFGVPQNRERVFIVGHLRGTSSKQIFPIGETNPISNRENREAQEERQRISSTLHSRYSSLQAQGETYLIHNVYGGFGEEPRIFEETSPTIRTPKGGGHLPLVVQPCLTPDRQKKRQHGRRFKENGEPMFTLTGQDIHGIAIKEPYIQNISHGFNEGWKKPYPNLRASATEHNELLVQGTRIRRLTPTECERLQGFPDGWTKGVSDTQRYKLLGNAVTVNVVEFLGEKLRRILEK